LGLRRTLEETTAEPHLAQVVAIGLPFCDRLAAARYE
jgi:hypothetical protein